MKSKKELIPLFKQFIRDTETGKRLKKNGERIRKSTVDNYKYTMGNLIEFNTQTGFELLVYDIQRATKKELVVIKNYWKKFYRQFTDFLYKKGCHDNYVGFTIKNIRVFFNYLKLEKDLAIGEFHKQFYVRKQDVEILVLSPEQLKFLIHDKTFENELIPSLKRLKDVFVFGCSTGLRYSDLFQLTLKNFEKEGEDWYLKLKTQKTKTFTFIKLPKYAVTIFLRYRPDSEKVSVFRKISIFNFNKMLKELGEKANFTQSIDVSREVQGKSKTMKKNIRFCDKMSSHMMRRTAITTHLILGMPEHLVRKISGHSSSSNSFNRYVHYAQPYIDREIEKVHEKLETL